MKKLIVTFLLIVSTVYSQTYFTQEWESPADKRYSQIMQFERNNSVLEIICRSTNMQTVYVYDGATKQVKYTYSDPDISAFNTNAYYDLRPIDVNNDGIYEVISYKNTTNPDNFKYKVINGANGQILNQNTYAGFYGSAYTIDIDGDGYTEILIDLSNSTTTKLIILSTTSNYVGIKNTDSEVDNYELKQNYPNPFNPNTKIEYTVPKTADVRLVIYDITGKEITSLVNEKQNAGTYIKDLSGTTLSSGTYFYQLSVNGIPETKKMILIK